MSSFLAGVAGGITVLVGRWVWVKLNGGVWLWGDWSLYIHHKRKEEFFEAGVQGKRRWWRILGKVEVSHYLEDSEC